VLFLSFSQESYESATNNKKKMKLSSLGMTYRIREKGKKKCIFDKTNEIKKQLKQVLPEIDGSRLIIMLGHCRRHYEGTLYYGRRTSNKEIAKKREKVKLTQMELLLYNFLLRNNLNPSTTYRWFLATRVPSEIKEQLEKGHISVKIAMQTAYNRKRVRESNQGLLMMEEMRIVMRGL